MKSAAARHRRWPPRPAARRPKAGPVGTPGAPIRPRPSPARRPSGRCWALWLIGLSLTSSLGLAEDTDQITYWSDAAGQRQSTVRGTIVDYTGEGLVWRTARGSEQRMAAEQVIRLETRWHPQQVAGDREMREGRFAEALAAYAQAFSEESRGWVRRKLLARSVRCLKHLDRLVPAVETFLRLVQSDPQTPYFADIPLGWRTVPLTSEGERRAQVWMQPSQPEAARLIGASWLLATHRREAAIATLVALRSRADSRIAMLAQAQLWRTQVATAGADELARWARLTARMPHALRAGAYDTRARGLAARGRSQEAVLTFLRVPILYGDREPALAAAALLDAGEQLERQGQPVEAGVLYREILRDYPQTASYQPARQRLEQGACAAGD